MIIPIPTPIQFSSFLVALFLTIFSNTLLAQDRGQSPQLLSVAEFQEKIAAMGLEFEMPEGFVAVPVIDNHDLGYQFAIRNKKKDFEIRYSISSLAAYEEEYQKSLLDSNVTMVSPDRLWEGMGMANGMNMTGGKMVSLKKFDQAAVQKEFNAEAGGVQYLHFKCQFAGKYKVGEAVYLHKSGAADVLITFMSKDSDKLLEQMSGPFHALKFKAE